MAIFFEIQLRAAKLAELFQAGLIQLGGLDIQPTFIFKNNESLVDGFEIINKAKVLAAPPPKDYLNPIVSVPMFKPNIGKFELVGIRVEDSLIPIIRQEIKVRIVKIADLQQNGSMPSPTEETIINVDFAFRGFIKINSDDAGYRFDLVNVHLGPELGAVSNAKELADSLSHSIEKLSLTDFQSITKFVSHSSNINQPSTEIGSNINTGIDPNAQRVSIRVELNEPDGESLEQWTPFLQGQMPDYIGSQTEWAVFVDERQLRASFKDTMQQWIARIGMNADISVFPIPEPTWSTDRNIKTTLSATAIDVCPGPNPFDKIDVDFSITSQLDHEIPEVDILQLRAKFTWSVNKLHAFICAAFLAQFGPFVAPLITDFSATGSMSLGGELAAGEYTLANLGGPLAYFAGTFASISRGLDARFSLAPTTFEEVSPTDSDKEFVRNLPFNLRFGRFELPDFDNKAFEIRTTLEGLKGLKSGLLLRGSIKTDFLSSQLTAAKIHIDDKPADFGWNWRKICSPERYLSAASSVVMRNSAIKKRTQLHQPLQLLEATVIDDPLGQYKPHVRASIIEEHGLIKADIPYNALHAEFLAKPYPLKILLRTTGGARILNLGTVDILSGTQQKVLASNIKVLEKTLCNPFVHILWGRIFNPEWMIDPPPYQQVIEHHWELTLTDITQKAQLTVSNNAGEPLVQQDINHGDTVVIPIILQSQENLGIGLKTLGNNGIRANDSAAKLEVRQAEIVEVSSFFSNSPIRSITAIRSSNEYEFSILTNTGATLLSMSDPHRPHAHAQFSGVFRGVTEAFDGTLIYGESGAFIHSGRKIRQLTDISVRDAASTRHELHVLTNQEILVFNKQGMQTRTMPSDNAQRILQVRNQVVALRDSKIVASTKSPNEEIMACARLLEKGTTSDFLHRVGEVLVDQDKESHIMSVNSRGQIEERLFYPNGAPWTLRAQRSGQYLARQTSRYQISFYSIGRIHQMTVPELEKGFDR